MIADIEALLRREGPLPLARVMALAADHYYATREPFGVAGDFVTAPEISQMFGELIGLWLADLWQRAGSPAPVALAELGPGRGTLMADALRAIAKAAPGLRAALSVQFVEKSPRLRALQAKVVPDATWHDDLSTLPDDRPLLLVANEFLDALPLTQFERVEDGWVMRRVEIGSAGPRWDRSVGANLAFLPAEIRDAPVGQVHERNFGAEQVAAAVARRLAAQGGAALFIDYGYAGPATGDTLQALKGGHYADPLQTLGEADVSAHVDFAAIARAARPNAQVFGPEAQGMFLESLGLADRAEALKRLASLERRAEIEAAHVRLTAPGAMGRLFQALALVAEGWPVPAGFPISAG
ncbi:class I SAM-dependent methyltransferase [Sandaracinobacter neustonicus]|uniref:Class I SAM-dependent methyltransferase n=1 Tax=Sandaracinobacter neustonicus TaxID=1715348 RepID=A0A501XFU0_9SPHN|nr:SAM-dependent methyltransferase [Sandaracinobacter neustonicus]TPE59442.1 class I SAM-dependent methyltransferase [Sandaracinobacter neustonicus]